MKKEMKKGIILNMQEYSIHDGEGVRTIVFLAGCNLRCKWCANPESWTMATKLIFHREKCIKCGKCAASCLQKLDPTKVATSRKKCRGCFVCANACYTGALDVIGRHVDVDDVLDQIKKDLVFYNHTGGGVTFSGGEPFLQYDFLRSLVGAISELGVNMCIETSGDFDFEVVRDIIEKLDYIYFDIKHMDRDKHKEYTGVYNDDILQNAIKVYDIGIPMTVRIPLIKGVNDDKDNLEATAKFINDNMKLVTVQLLPYHELGKGKYIAMGMLEEFTSFETPSKEEVEEAYEIFRNYDINTVLDI
ncbi:MAG: glycyl-radical enzyme activating protein [Anaerovoracaceae bacterium]